jgi:hypothetical protein
MVGAQQLARACLIGSLVLTGCLSAADDSVPQATVQDRTAQATGPAATPSELHPQIVFSDLAVLPGAESGIWMVLGLARNDSRYALEGVVVSVELLDPAGLPIASASLPLALSILQPGATSPIMARFERVGPPAGARAGLVTFRSSAEPLMHVSVDAVRPGPSSEGTLVLGSLRNGGPGLAEAREVIVVWRDADHTLSGMAAASVPHSLIPEDGSVPWLAVMPGTVQGGRFEVFTAVAAVDESLDAPLDQAIEPMWRVTEQGNGFAIGAIRNSGSRPALPEVAVAVRVNGRLVSLAILQSAVPLPPGEMLPFGVDQFPGLEVAPDPGDVAIEVYLTGRGTDPGAPAAVPLAASIHQFEVIGGRVFMQGVVTNPGPAPLTSAMVFVSLRSTIGDAQTARWLALTPPQPGESAEFFVDVPLAAGDDPAMSEYDVRAFGLPLPESSW